ncbi:NitT/TauT family transport system permease protein [Tindallia magadiensis]|uniref:NitT/TauT family transport system permease protein n=1 Tax=Tindallia magadiensis TaxID=69895 RepID=A0A1I3EMZ7_9FIRM|nr:ABC transporter permease [Tindallia magadiensis]SFI00243.1 NitT/TauT family transport system permease protein [Tindallia magadiensis]
MKWLNLTFTNAKELGIRLSGFVILILFWEFAVRIGWLNPFYTSQPTGVYYDLIEFYESGQLWRHTSVTLKEALWGLFFGSVAGIVVAFILGFSQNLAKVFEPLITGLYGIPKLALAPIFVLWFGLGIESKIIMSALLVFFLVFFSTYGGIQDIDRNIVRSIRLMGATPFQIKVKVYLPATVPWILAGIKGGLGASLIGAIVGEYMGASAGLGWMISYATSFFQVERVMSCIFILFMIGVIFNGILKTFERVLLKWRAPTDFDQPL